MTTSDIATSLIKLLQANVDNMGLSDAAFRSFVRNSLSVTEPKPDKAAIAAATIAASTLIEEKKLDDRLIILLKLAKSQIHKHEDWSWKLVVQALAETYTPNMGVKNALYHCVAALAEVAKEPKFQSYHPTQDIFKLLISPVDSFQILVNGIKPDAAYTSEQWFNSQIQYILGILSTTATGWCKDQLDDFEYKEYVPSPTES